MQTYILDPNALAIQRQRSLKQAFFLYGIPIGGVLALLAVLNRGDFSFNGLIVLAGAAMSALLVVGLFVWADLRTLKAQWFTYQLILADEHITRRAARVPEIQILRSEIT